MGKLETAFDLLGLPEKFSLTEAQIEDAWRARIALVHPDRFASAGAAAKRVAEQWAGRLNDAKTSLLDPVARAKILLSARGVDIGEESDTRMPPDFLFRAFSLRERVEAGEREAVLREITEERKELTEKLSTFLDVNRDDARAREAVRELLFVEKLSRDLESH